MKKLLFSTLIITILYSSVFISPGISRALAIAPGVDYIYLYENEKRVYYNEISVISRDKEEPCEKGLCIIPDNLSGYPVTMYIVKEDYSIDFRTPSPKIIEVISSPSGMEGGLIIYEDRAFALNIPTGEYIRIPLEVEPAENFHENAPYIEIESEENFYEKEDLLKKFLTTENIIYFIVLLLVLVVVIAYIFKKRKTVNKDKQW